MDTNVIWIIVAVVAALIVLGIIVALARKSRNRRRAVEADRIREEVHHDTRRVERQASLVEETEAKARAAKAEAEVKAAEAEAKAAEAARLADTASSRRDALTSSQEHIEARRQHADKLDPRHRNADQADAAGHNRGDVGDNLNAPTGVTTHRDDTTHTVGPDTRTR